MKVDKGKAMRFSAIAALFLLLFFVALWVILGLGSEQNVYNFFLGAIIFCVALVTVSVFQAFRISESAEVIAEGLAQDLLQSTHNLFTELYKNSPVPYILIDRVGIITSTNIASLRLFRVGAGQLDGKNIFEYIHGEDEQHIDFISGKFSKGISVDDEEVRVRVSDGSERWVILSLFPFEDERGDQQGFLTLVDITKQKEVDQAKSEFVSLASHQLRTPLTAMKWSLELLAERSKEELTDTQRKYLKKVGSNLRRMTNLINDFLSVSKFELGTYATDFTSVHLPGVVEELLDENNHPIEEKHLQISVDIDEDVQTIVTDLPLVRMILGNLISNATKYSREGGTVAVKVRKSSEMAIVTVEDTGMGIPAEDQEMLFTKMFRAKNARRDVPDGTGLGLYIVEYAVRTLGGKITFESQEGRGTTFRVELPV